MDDYNDDKECHSVEVQSMLNVLRAQDMDDWLGHKKCPSRPVVRAVFARIEMTRLNEELLILFSNTAGSIAAWSTAELLRRQALE